MLRKQDYKTSTMIALNIVGSTIAVGDEITPATIAKGQVLLADLQNRKIAAYPTSGPVRIIQGLGSSKPLHIVDIEDVANTEVTWKKFIPGVEQVTVIGYDPVTGVGTLPSANDTSYYIRIKKLDNDAANRSQPASAIVGQYKTSNAASQQEAALGLADQLFKNTLFEVAQVGKPGYLKVSVVSDATIIAGIVGTGSVAYGSKLVQLAAAPAGGVVVGDEIQILTDTYTVEALDAVNNTITLTSPYRGSSITATPIDDAFTTPAVDYGIKIEGVRNEFDVATFRDYYRNRFEVLFSDTNTKPKLVAASFEGVGEWEEVAMNEYLSFGFLGQNHMIAVPPQSRDAIVAALSKYGTIQVRWATQEKDLLTTGNFKGSVLLYAELVTLTGVLTPANAGGVLLAQFVANTALAAKGLTANSLNQ